MHRALALILALAATAAFAHSGVQNPEVKARMEQMKEIAAATKVLGTMANRERPFDAAAARAAATRIADGAAQAPDYFEARASDPKSDARAAIWENFGDFEAKAAALKAAASTAAAGIRTEDDLRPALARIGGACKGCHEAYRE